MFNLNRAFAFIVFVFSIMTVHSVVAAPTQFSAFGGAGYSSVDVEDGSASASRDPGTAFGAALETPVGETTGVEIGVIRQPNSLQIPLLLRYGAEKIFTAGAGVFAETGTGDNTRKDFVLGWNVLAGLNFPFGDQTRGFVEGRYLQDFAEASADDSGLLALAGLRIAFE